MSTCIRNGVKYKRHEPSFYRDGSCICAGLVDAIDSEAPSVQSIPGDNLLDQAFETVPMVSDSQSTIGVVSEGS